MNAPVRSSAEQHGLTEVTSPNFARHNLGDGLFIGTDLGSRGGSDLLSRNWNKARTTRTSPSLKRDVWREIFAGSFRYVAGESGRDDDSGVRTILGMRGFISTGEDQQEEMLACGVPFQIELDTDITHGDSPNEVTTWVYRTGQIVPLASEMTEPLRQANNAIVYIIRKPVSTTGSSWPTRVREMTTIWEESAEGEVMPDLAHGIWITDTVYGVSAQRALSMHESPPATRSGDFEVAKAASEEARAPLGDEALVRIRALRSAPGTVQPPWADTPTQRAFDDAEAFVNAWPSVRLQKPDVGLADDGEVNFLWKGPELHVDLGFYGDGTFSYFARDRDGTRHAGDDLNASDGLPENLVAILKA